MIGGTVQGEEGAQTVSGDVKRLEPNTQYEVRLIVSNEGGGETVVATFDTKKSRPRSNRPPAPPTAKAATPCRASSTPITRRSPTAISNGAPTPPNWSSAPTARRCRTPAPNPLPSKPISPASPLAPPTTPSSSSNYGADLEEDSGNPQEFKPTLAKAEPCPENERQRTENNSLALPECRAYEMVYASWQGRVRRKAGDLRRRRASCLSLRCSEYRQLRPRLRCATTTSAARSADGWGTIPDLNGSSGSFRDAPSDIIGPYNLTHYSRICVRRCGLHHRRGVEEGPFLYLRRPDGTFALVGSGNQIGNPGQVFTNFTSGGVSDDLSHISLGSFDFGVLSGPTPCGLGVYEFVGTGNDQPRRVDFDNAAAPASTCIGMDSEAKIPLANAMSRFTSTDGRVIVFSVAGGCGGSNPPADELWARVDGTTSFNSPPPSATGSHQPATLPPSRPSSTRPPTAPASSSPPTSSWSTPTPTRPATSTPATSPRGTRPRSATPTPAPPSSRSPAPGQAPTSRASAPPPRTAPRSSSPPRACSPTTKTHLGRKPLPATTTSTSGARPLRSIAGETAFLGRLDSERRHQCPGHPRRPLPPLHHRQPAPRHRYRRRP